MPSNRADSWIKKLPAGEGVLRRQDLRAMTAIERGSSDFRSEASVRDVALVKAKERFKGDRLPVYGKYLSHCRLRLACA
jgi:hypothetical protein